MRQNPMLQNRMQVGGRSMPAWFSASLVTQSRIGAPSPTPPPLPVAPPPDESDYEEIDHIPKSAMKKLNSRRACSLCGNPNPAVSCEMCNNQIFCGSCNDMYHRHPKRQHHSRKILDPLENRPPIPPKTPVPPEMMQAQLPPLPPQHPGQYPSHAISTPQPPPRRKGRFGMRSAAGSPTPGIKSIFDPVGTLKRFMGGMAHRPLPPTPKPPPPLPPKPADMGRSITPTPRFHTLGDRRLSSPQPGNFPQNFSDPRGRMPMAVSEMQNARHHSISVANLSGHTSSRDSGYPDWEEDEDDIFSRNRAHSISHTLGRFPSTSQDAPHFATLHRPGRNLRQQMQSQPQLSQASQDAPERPPPPLPPRQFPSQTQLSFSSSQSAFDLDRMAAVAQQQQFAGMPPWNGYPMPGYPFEMQQAMMMGYPTGTMHRTPSTQSMGPTMNPSAAQNQQGFFGWGPMGFGPPMTPMEMEMMAGHHRRGSEMNLLPHQQTQRNVPLSNPVTPQGSFRKKAGAGRHMSVEPEFTRRLERGLDLTQNRRSGTPSSFVRVPQPQPSASSTPSSLSSSGKIKPPAKPPSDNSPDDSYFSAERQHFTESTASSESTPEVTEEPEGPWECEHCTFINPKSTKVCTICCKTPSEGYKVMKGNRRGIPKAKLSKREMIAMSQQHQAASKRRDSNRDSSSASNRETGAEEVPVLKSKLSISREKQQAKINLVSKVENERVKAPGKSVLKPGSSGTLKAGSVPPGLKVAVAAAAVKKVGKGRQQKTVVPDESDDEEDEDEEEVEDPDTEDDQVESNEENEQEIENDDENEDELGDNDADDEDGVVDVKISSGSSKLAGRAGIPSTSKAMPITGRKMPVASGGRAPKKFTKGRRVTNAATKKLVDSNEDVYGSVPIQTLAISPKIEIRRSSKSKVPTGVGSSPPSSSEPSMIPSSPNLTVNTTPPPDSEEVETKDSAITEGTSKRTRKGSKKGSKKDSNDSNEKINESSRASPELSTIVVSSSGSAFTKQKRGSVTTGIQTGSDSKRDSIGTGESETGSSSPFRAKKDSDDVTVSVDSTKIEKKSSVGVGTSPPPQNISTQTYEDTAVAGADTASITSPQTKSSSKTSLRSDEYEPPRQIEMSEKAMRYARKARSKEQQYQKLKRSMSTHLTYPADREPWMDSAEGRHLYRSSSRQSLASDTRSLPLSGPPSRESSPPPMGRYGGNSSRGGWYEDFRRYPSSTMWESKYGMPPPPGDFFASIDDLMSRRRRESMRSQDFELTRMLRDAEESNFTPEDVQVAIRMCGDKNPIKWLQENWSSIIETVQTLATKYGREKGAENNDVGTISKEEARDSIRANRGNVWAAVTECVDQRRKKFHELQSRGTFLREDILTVLTANHGNLEASYVELSKAQLKPFLMRIWGPPTDPDNESVAPSSSDEGKSMKPLEETEPLPVSSSGRSNSLPASDKAVTSKAKQSRKTSLRKLSTSDVKAEQRPLNEMQDSNNAEIVMQQIGKAIEELNISEAFISSIPDEKAVIEKLAEISGTAKELENQQKSESESEPSCAPAQHVKSDGDGEDESFVDAVSGSASIANSPPPLPPPSQLENEPTNYIELPIEINNNEIIDIIENDDNGAIGEDEFEDDVLEIEIDDTEANISEFIQNYEILPVATNAVTASSEEMDKSQKEGHQSDAMEGTADPNTEIEEEVEEDENDQLNNPNGAITKVEMEQLLTTLTSTFTSMEQFAHKIKENIASEIQQQLAAATAKSKTSHDHSEDGSYEPIALSPGIEEHVNKKMAKYQRLAAKKKQKVARHKSPETREFQFGTNKELSVSPLPTSSKGKEGSTEISISRDSTEPEQNEDESERAETTASHFSDYEEVEIGQEEVEQQEEDDDINGDAEADGADGEFVVEEEEDINESSIVEESEEELNIEVEDEPQEEEDGGENNIYANVALTSGASITPNDTDKVIIPGSGGLSATVKAIRNSSTNNSNNAVVIVAEDLTQLVENQEEKTEDEAKEEVEEEDTPSKRLIREGKVNTPSQAELAMQLLEMHFSEDDALAAAKECASLDSALSFLQQECDLCTGKFSVFSMVSMLRCTHLCCRNCARDYFTVQVRDKTIVDATCPFCAEPSTLTDDSELATEYFNHLDILLKNLLDSKHHEMFQRKLRDWTLAKTPNFKWCSKCSSGFITEPMQTRLVCPDCKAVTCAICMEAWDKVNHNHRDDTTGASKKLCDTVPKSIIEYLNANHTECPRCHFRFSLARGGCMHLTCTQCHHEFCSGCAAPFRMGEKCEAKYPICDKLGLHAHHPRNCLFYLRDKEPDVLSKLLEENAIPYFKENSGEAPTEGEKPKRACQVPIQKETADGYLDDVCEKEAPLGFATVCRAHYIEYLGLLIWQNHLDPITILTNDDLEVIVRRAYKKHPGRPNWLSDEGFRKRLLKVINDEIPL